ncbi:MAG: 1,4-alpha-glucan branching enzyme, partial [Sedimenticola sp.]
MATALNKDLRRIIDARHHDPFAILGRHIHGNKERVTLFLPGAVRALIEETGAELTRLNTTDLFVWEGAVDEQPDRYRVRATYAGGAEHCTYDPYCFPAVLEDFDLHLFGEGGHYHAYRFLGAHPCSVDGVEGVVFAVWAPNAERVSVVGNFNQWDGRRHPMRSRGTTGVWELFIPGLTSGELYKYEIRNRKSGAILQKTDPYAQQYELRPKTASQVKTSDDFSWSDQQWLQQRRQGDWLHKPLSIYEVHLGSWLRDESRKGG